MKLVTFLHQSSEKIGAIIDDEIIDFISCIRYQVVDKNKQKSINFLGLCIGSFSQSKPVRTFIAPLIDSDGLGSEFSKYIYYSFQSNIIQKQIDETMGATINQLTNRNLFEFKILNILNFYCIKFLKLERHSELVSESVFLILRC